MPLARLIPDGLLARPAGLWIRPPQVRFLLGERTQKGCRRPGKHRRQGDDPPSIRWLRPSDNRPADRRRPVRTAPPKSPLPTRAGTRSHGAQQPGSGWPLGLDGRGRLILSQEDAGSNPAGVASAETAGVRDEAFIAAVGDLSPHQREER